MRRLALIALALIASDVGAGFGQGGGLGCPKGFIATSWGCAYSYAFFEFAPSTGVGMGSACACTTPTGAKGEVLTFTRASSGTCLKSTSATNIANGDLVTCATNQPRVMPGFDPSGVLGLLVESSRTNLVVQSQALDNAAWVNFVGTGGTNPVVTANAGTAPDSTVTAEQVVFAATSGTQSSTLAQAALTAAAYSGSVFAQPISGTCTLDLCIETNATGPVATCTATTITAGAWTRMATQNVTSIASGRVFVGNATSLNGGAARSACTALVWGTQAEAGAYATSYIATTTVAVTRSAETAITGVSFAAGTGSMAATVLPLGTATGGYVGSSTVSHGLLSVAAGQLSTYVENAARVTAATSIPAASVSRIAGWWDGTNVAAVVNGSATQAANVTVVSTAQPIRIGDAFAVSAPDAVVKQVCYQPADPTRCR